MVAGALVEPGIGCGSNSVRGAPAEALPGSTASIIFDAESLVGAVLCWEWLFLVSVVFLCLFFVLFQENG